MKEVFLTQKSRRFCSYAILLTVVSFFAFHASKNASTLESAFRLSSFLHKFLSQVSCARKVACVKL